MKMSPLLTFLRHRHMGGAAARKRVKSNIAGHRKIAMAGCLLDVRLCKKCKQHKTLEIQRDRTVKIKYPEHFAVLDINNYSPNL